MAKHLEAMIVSAAIALSACNSALEFKENRNWNTAAVYTTADTRIVTQRPDPLGNGRPIVCTEPLPDTAKALASAAQLQASGGDGAINASASASLASSQALTELAGRSTALLGLRDGLYRTCEAYANGALGDAAYALVLGRYAQLMATLFLSQDIQASTVTLGTASAPSVSAPTPDKPTPDKPAATTPGAPNKVSAMAGPPDRGALAQPIDFAAATPVKAAAALTDGVKKSAGTPGPGESPATTAAEAILQMHKAYLDLDGPAGLLHLLLVVCINEQDPTRPGRAQLAPSTGLDPLCERLPNLLQSVLDQTLVGSKLRPAAARSAPARRSGG